MPPQGARPPATSYTRPAPSRGKRVERAGRVARCLRARVPMGGTRNRERPCHAASSVPHSPRHQMPPQGASLLSQQDAPGHDERGAAYSLPFPVASTGLGRRTGQRAMRALRRPRHRRGPVARSTWPRRRRTTRHQTTRRLRRVFEQERRPFMLAIKELRHPAAACARSDRRQSREVRAVGRGGAQCDGLSEDASVRPRDFPRVSHGPWSGEVNASC